MDEKKNRKAQLSSKKMKGPGALAMEDGRKWGGGMACSGRQKECSIVPKDVSSKHNNSVRGCWLTFSFLSPSISVLFLVLWSASTGGTESNALKPVFIVLWLAESTAEKKVRYTNYPN